MPLTLDEARARAALLSDVSYDLHLDLTDRSEFAVRAVVRFACATPGASTFLELARATEVRVDGAPAAYDGGRIALADLGASHEVTVEARIPYVTDGDGMHTFTDPADGETYVSAYLGMDICQRVFPCFDQTDLKAPITLTVTAPEGWTVLANGRGTQTAPGEWAFATTPPIPNSQFVVCAGPWASYTWEHAGLPFGWHARQSLAAELDRDAEELRRITESCFDHYAQIFEEPYPYDSYDQAFVPGQNWGALETPGCVTYRDEILPVGRVSESEARARAVVIAHEMCHMWFGNLVTMTWWEDTWLQESFADYMGYRVAGDAAGYAGTTVSFTVARKVQAYDADQRRSTHPVAPLAEEVPDVDAAANNFDGISYAKGNAVLRQLVTWLGDEAFLRGVNAYLTRHRFANATLDDFVSALDEATDRDVRTWVALWLRETGFDTLRVTRDGDGLLLHRDGTRSHTVSVVAHDDDLVPAAAARIEVGDEPVRLATAPLVVPNAGGETFARLRLDDASWEAVERHLVSVPDPDVRALLWHTAYDRCDLGETSAEEHLGLVNRHLPREPHVAIVETVLTQLRTAVLTRRVPVDAAATHLAGVAAVCEAGLASEPGEEVALAFTRALAATTPDALLLEGWLVDRVTHTGLAVDLRLRWTALQRLAALGAVGPEEIAEERSAEPGTVGDLGAVRALAALPDADAKEAAWQRMFGDPEVSNRAFVHGAEGFWQPEQRDLVAAYVDRYLAEAPAVAERRGQAFSQLVGAAFPAVPLSDDEVSRVEQALAGDLPTVLRRKWEDKYDDVVRARRVG